jgi:hypothetical protein
MKDKIEKGDMLMLRTYQDANGGFHNDEKLYRTNDKAFSFPLDFNDPSFKRSDTAQKIYDEI